MGWLRGVWMRGGSWDAFWLPSYIAIRVGEREDVKLVGSIAAPCVNQWLVCWGSVPYPNGHVIAEFRS